MFISSGLEDHLEYIGETVIGGNTIMGPKSHLLELRPGETGGLGVSLFPGYLIFDVGFWWFVIFI